MSSVDVRIYVQLPLVRSFVPGESNLTIDCYGNGKPQPNVTWYYNGKPVRIVNQVYPSYTSDVVQVIWTDISDKIQNVSSRLYLRPSGIRLNDAGNYTCKAWNAVNGSDEKTVEVLCRFCLSCVMIDVFYSVSSIFSSSNDTK